MGSNDHDADDDDDGGDDDIYDFSTAWIYVRRSLLPGFVGITSMATLFCWEDIYGGVLVTSNERRA